MKTMADRGKRIGGGCRLAVLASLSVLLFACVEQPPPPPVPAAAAVAPAPKSAVAHRRHPAHAKRKPAASSHEEAAQAEPQAEVAMATPPSGPAAPPPGGPAVPSARELVGIDQQRAAEMLGPAAATEAKSPATVWHYKSSRCELDLAFYMEMRTGRMRSLHYDFKNGADTPEQRHACLKTIIEENRKGEPS
jgi:hypothetical protein